MKSKQGSLHAILSKLCLLLICAAILTSNVLAQEGVTYKSGRVKFNAGGHVLSIPFGVNALIFDTTRCIDCKDSLPPWRYFGNLKIDSLILPDGVHPLTDPSQVDNLSINSDSLIVELYKINPRILRKIFPKRKPGQTTVWDEVRQKFQEVPDLSMFYEITFSEELHVDSALNLLHEVKDLNDVFPSAIFFSDGMVDCSLFSPNDSFYNAMAAQWQFWDWDAVNDTGGARIQCALSMVEAGKRGSGMEIEVMSTTMRMNAQ